MRRRLAIGGLLGSMLVVRNGILVHLKLFDALPELVLLVVVAVAMLEGPEAGAMVGFAGGLLQDLTNSLTPVGLSCLAFVLVGFGAGLAHSYIIRPGRLLPFGIGAVAAFAAALAIMLAGGLMGQEHLVSTHQLRVAVWASCYSAVAFPGVQFLARRVLEAVQLHRAPV